MSKQIITIGYEVPGRHDNYVDFGEAVSFMDADVVLISPDSIKPWGDWVRFTSSDSGCYNVDASNRYIKNIAHLKKELEDHLKAGKNVFI